jgi:hypothetical protein
LQHALQQLLEPLQELLFLHFEDAAPFAQQAAGDSLTTQLRQGHVADEATSEDVGDDEHGEQAKAARSTKRKKTIKAQRKLQTYYYELIKEAGLPPSALRRARRRRTGGDRRWTAERGREVVSFEEKGEAQRRVSTNSQ